MKQNDRGRGLIFGVLGLGLGVIAGPGLGVAHADDLGDLWAERAELAQQSLEEAYWQPSERIFAIRYPADPNATALNYWWQAHGVDALVDGYERTGESHYILDARTQCVGLMLHNGGLLNDYYDDMEWFALSMQRMVQHSGSATFRGYVRNLWNDIKGGWNENQGGGIAWRKSQLDYKNTPANAPAVILGARLYMQEGNQDDLDWAIRIYDWLQDTLIDPETGFAWDGINRTGDGTIDTNWAFTYNQGVVIGAGIELYRATGDDRYLIDARRTFLASVDRLVLGNGLINESGQGDGGLFRGIYIRYIGELAAIDVGLRDEAYRIIRQNATIAWAYSGNRDPILFSNDWRSSPPSQIDLSTQLSGVMLMEQMARHSACEEPTVDDLLDFLAAFGEQDISQADYAPEGNPDGVLNVDDVLGFLADFAEGCG